MTEVPEHLLQRSRDRRAALGLGGGDGGGDAASAAAPAAAASTAVTPAAAATPAATAAPAEVAPKEPAFVPSYVAASERRKRVPVWAMPVLAFLPVWGVIYAQTLSPPPSTTKTQLAAGADVYQPCSSCHGSSGGGGVGRKFSDGEVVKTFPNIAHQLEFVKLGTPAFQGKVYGSPARPGGAHTGGSFGNMPAWPKLTDLQLLEVVRHERETLGGETDIKIDGTGARQWPNGKPMLDSSGKLIWDDGTPMFNAEGHLTKQVDASKPPAA